MREYCKQGQVEVVSNSRNKIHQIWGQLLSWPCRETKSKDNGKFGLSHYHAPQTRYSRCADNGFLEECISAGGEKATESRKCKTAAIACAEENGTIPLMKETKAKKVGSLLKAKNLNRAPPSLVRTHP